MNKNKLKQYGDEVGRLDGLFTDGRCTAAAIGKAAKGVVGFGDDQ